MDCSYHIRKPLWFSITEQALANLENIFDASSTLIIAAKIQAVLWVFFSI